MIIVGSIRTRLFPGIVILLSLIATSLALPQNVQAGGGIQLFVDTPSDNPALSGCITGTPGDCSLRGAIQHVNDDIAGTPPVYEIVLSATTYTLTRSGEDDTNSNGDLDTIPQNDLYITGASQTGTTIDANLLDRVIDHHGPGMLTISKLTLRDGQVATGRNGGAGIRNINGGTLWLSEVTVDSNTVLGSNAAQDMGGGIHSTERIVNIEHSTISNNEAMLGGGLELGNTTLFMDESTISDNDANGSSGGGIDTGDSGTFTILRSRIINNTAAGGAGGFYSNAGADLTMVDTLVAGNSSSAGSGGGMMLFGTAAISNVTVSGNSVPAGAYGGGLYISASLAPDFTRLTNVTITDNTAYWGGGIFIGNTGNVNLNHVTLANNNLHAGGDGSAVYMHDGGTSSGGTFSFTNNIFSDTYFPTQICYKVPGATFTITDNRYNLFDNFGTGCLVASQPGDVSGVAGLGSLGYYGGWTPVLPIISPLSDAIDAVYIPDTSLDQRSHSRKDGDHDGTIYADIGAFEYESDILWLPLIVK